MDHGIIWKPSEELIENSNVSRFIRLHVLQGAAELLKKSVDDQQWFWRSLEKDLNVRWGHPYSELLDSSGGPEFSRWYLEGKFNLSGQLVDFQIGNGKGSHIAILYEDEDGTQEKITYNMLFNSVCSFSSLLKEEGISRGDRVGIFMPMMPETVIAFLSITRIGAIAVPVFSGFGSEALLQRFDDTGIIACVTVDVSLRRGKRILHYEMVSKLRSEIPTMRYIFRLRKDKQTSGSADNMTIDWKAEFSAGRTVLPEKTEAEDFALILYSSGTTGRPKGTVHTHIGVFLQPAKEGKYNLDLMPEERLFWLSDLGWVMGPWSIVAALSQGATLAILGGAPDYPSESRLWRFIENFGITTLGISPTLIRSQRKYGDQQLNECDLTGIRIIASGGEPWDLDNYMWVFDKIGARKTPIINLSGGTELMGSLLIPLPILPLKPCTLQSPGLGMAIDSIDDNGNSVVGTVGYLVCRKPVPSMTKGFWKDKSRYLNTYWSKFPGIWYHGDWSLADSDGFWFLLGRADDLIKVGGKRIGPSEIEEVLLKDAGIFEAAAIGVPDDVKGEAIVCFAVLINARKSDDIKSRLMHRIEESLGRPFVPREIYFTSALPKTHSGKISRSSLKQIFTNSDFPANLSSIDNPDLMAEIRALAESEKAKRNAQNNL